MCASFNPSGTWQDSEGKKRSGSNIARNFLDPTRFGGIWGDTKKETAIIKARKTEERDKKLGINQPAKVQQNDSAFQSTLDAAAAKKKRIQSGIANKINYSLSV